jgi:hypothetical protein
MILGDKRPGLSGAHPGYDTVQISKSFLVLFFKKEHFLSFFNRASAEVSKGWSCSFAAPRCR